MSFQYEFIEDVTGNIPIAIRCPALRRAAPGFQYLLPTRLMPPKDSIRINQFSLKLFIQLSKKSNIYIKHERNDLLKALFF